MLPFISIHSLLQTNNLVPHQTPTPASYHFLQHSIKVWRSRRSFLTVLFSYSRSHCFMPKKHPGNLSPTAVSLYADPHQEHAPRTRLPCLHKKLHSPRNAHHLVLTNQTHIPLQWTSSREGFWGIVFLLPQPFYFCFTWWHDHIQAPC